MTMPRFTHLLIAGACLLLGLRVLSIWDHRLDPVTPAVSAEKKDERPRSLPTSTVADAPPRPARQEDRPASFNNAELEVLQALAKRRDDLDKRSGDLDLRENLLKVAEKRVDERINELKALEAKVAAMVKQVDEEEERNLRSLVKVYENMKPRDAARIFERLEDKVLLSVVERMKEAKLAPVLADMDPLRAQKLTVDLATRRQLNSQRGS